MNAIEGWRIARVGDMNIINFISQIKQKLKPFFSKIVLLRNLLNGIFNYYWILILKPMIILSASTLPRLHCG